jgi:hypothetical protein
LDAAWSILLLPFLPIIFIFGLVLFVIIIVIFLALWITVGIAFIVGMFMFGGAILLLAIGRLPKNIAIILMLVGGILMLLSMTGVFEIAEIETTYQMFPGFDVKT